MPAKVDPAPTVLTLYATDCMGSTVQLEAVSSRRYRERFFTMFATTASLISSFDRPAAYHRALLAFLTLGDPVQFRRISARQVAEAAHMSPISAERALALLESDGVLISNALSTGAKARRINNRLVWASTAAAHSAATPDVEIIDSRGRR